MKLQAKDLRIENLIIRDDYEMVIYQIEKMYKNVWRINDIKIDFDDEIQVNKLCRPTPLTEEWLVKFGYLYSSTLFDFKIYRKGIYFVSIFNGNIVFGIKEDSGSKYFPLVRRSEFPVHLLQNLHQDLGEELTIKK